MQRTHLVKAALVCVVILAGCADVDPPSVAAPRPSPPIEYAAVADGPLAARQALELGAALEQVAHDELVASFEAWAATWPPPPPPPTTGPSSTPTGGGAPGARSAAGVRVSRAWLEQLATCESGWPDTSQTWRTGFFGLEAGYPIGGLSWDEQAAWVQRIIDGGGWPSAWGCSSVVPWPY